MTLHTADNQNMAFLIENKTKDVSVNNNVVKKTMLGFGILFLLLILCL